MTRVVNILFHIKTYLIVHLSHTFPGELLRGEEG